MGIGPLCADCLLLKSCGAAHSEHACHPDFGAHKLGGLNVLHPARHDLEAYFAEIDGPELETVRAQAVAIPELPIYVPRIRARRALKGQLQGDFYAVGADQAIAGRRFVLAADELREIVDLWGNQGLMLVLFGKDPLLEAIWGWREKVVEEIAAANYDLVIPPSFSAWSDRPAVEFLFNAKRSMVFFQLLQEAGVPTAPRLAWLSEFDVRRAARWCQSNPAVQLVTLDLAIKQPAEWAEQLELLTLFDQLTDRRLTFLIHGPSSESRIGPLFGVLGSRLCLSGSRAISRPRNRASDFVVFEAQERDLARRMREESIEASSADAGHQLLRPLPAQSKADRSPGRRSLAA
jgi:hypothetical protein